MPSPACNKKARIAVPHVGDIVVKIDVTQTRYVVCMRSFSPVHFFFNDAATTEIYTLSLHDALPICTFSYLTVLHELGHAIGLKHPFDGTATLPTSLDTMSYTIMRDRKSTRLNSSHSQISYAVSCLQQKSTHCRAPRRGHCCKNRCNADSLCRMYAILLSCSFFF